MTGIEKGSPFTSIRSEESAHTAASRAKRDQILRGAGSVFLASGYEAASMAQIARKAGVSKGTLYNHFDSKAALFSAFFEQESRTKLTTLLAAINDEETDFRTSLIQLATSAIQFMLSPTSMGLYRIIVAEAARFPHLADTFWRYSFQMVLTRLSEWYTRKTVEGITLIDDPCLAAEQFMMLCQTRIVQRRRFMLPVQDDVAAVEKIATFVADTFLKLYGTQHQ